MAISHSSYSPPLIQISKLSSVNSWDQVLYRGIITLIKAFHLIPHMHRCIHWKNVPLPPSDFNKVWFSKTQNWNLIHADPTKNCSINPICYQLYFWGSWKSSRAMRFLRPRLISTHRTCSLYTRPWKEKS